MMWTYGGENSNSYTGIKCMNLSTIHSVPVIICLL